MNVAMQSRDQHYSKWQAIFKMLKIQSEHIRNYMINKVEIIAECPFENRKRCGELMSQLMIQAGADKICVPMKCDVEKFFYWYGPDVEDVDDDITLKQYNDYMTTGKYYDREHYEN